MLVSLWLRPLLLAPAPATLPAAARLAMTTATAPTAARLTLAPATAPAAARLALALATALAAARLAPATVASSASLAGTDTFGSDHCSFGVFLRLRRLMYSACRESSFGMRRRLRADYSGFSGGAGFQLRLLWRQQG